MSLTYLINIPTFGKGLSLLFAVLFKFPGFQFFGFQTNFPGTHFEYRADRNLPRRGTLYRTDVSKSIAVIFFFQFCQVLAKHFLSSQ